MPVPNATSTPAVHSLSKASLTSAFAPRSNESPAVSLHGGVQGFDSHVWEPILNVRDAKLFTPEELAYVESELPGQSAVIFARTSEDGEEGYPGRLRVETLVALVPPKGKAIEEDGAHCLGSVVVVYRAQLEEDDKVTPINLTQVRSKCFIQCCHNSCPRDVSSTGASTSMLPSKTASLASKTTN